MDAIYLPGPIMRGIFEHVHSTGQPLLRQHRSDDIHVITADPMSDDDYELLFGENPGELFNIESWEDLADHFGLGVETMVQELRDRGYPWSLPSLDDPPSEWGRPEPEDAERVLRPILSESGPTIDSVLSGLFTNFLPDPDTEDPGIPTHLDDAREFLASGGIQGPYETDSLRSGHHSMVITVDSPIGLSCLQAALDHLQQKVWIRLG